MIGAQPRVFVTFDRSVIKTNWRKINEGPMKRAGLLVRRIARGLIRPGGKKRKPSAAGTPPRSQRPGTNPPFKLIYSVPIHAGTSALVGMVGFGGEAVPGLHEHGGMAARWVWIPKPGQQRKKRGQRGKAKERRERVRKVVRYPKRDFMQPALIKAKDKMPQLWRGSVSR